MIMIPPNLPPKSKNFLKTPFHLLTISLLSLLIPLSFLLLSRLSYSQYLSSLYPNPNSPQRTSFFFSVILYANPFLLHSLISFITISTLYHNLSCQFTLLPQPHNLYKAWIFLCTFQVCVGMSIEGNIAFGLEMFDLGLRFGLDKGLWCRKVLLFVGLYETMVYWSRMVVKPVVDDTVFGGLKEEKCSERVVMCLSFGVLWWGRLRNEVELLVVVIENKREMMMRIGLVDLSGWCLYYVSVIIGIVKVLKGVWWAGKVLVCKRELLREKSSEYCGVEGV